MASTKRLHWYYYIENRDVATAGENISIKLYVGKI